MLSIVPTPIGNLNDISPRALEALRAAVVIACEDTRQTRKLLDHYQITTPTISYHQHSGMTRCDELVERARTERVALVTDAGTPTISDPGHLLIAAAEHAGVPIVSIPGPSAIMTALAGSGFDVHHFSFFGFLPHKKGRQKLLDTIITLPHAVVLYESKHRILKLLDELAARIPERRLCLGRELTKIHEEFLRGTAHELKDILTVTPEKQKGEFVVVIDRQ